MKKLLVIGGTGFIGSKVVDEGIKRSFQVTSISLNKKNIDNLNKKAHYYFTDINNNTDLKKIVSNNFEYVINLSGYINHEKYFNSTSDLMDTHFNGVKNIVKNLNRSNLIKFVQIGSSDEYGQNISPQVETYKDMPFTPYSLAKSMSTNFIQMLNKSENFPGTIIRLFLTYGPGQKSNRFIPQTVLSCLQNKELITTKGNQIRDFCYIDDVVDGLFLCLDNENINGEILNIASGIPIKIKDVVKIILEKTNHKKVSYGKLKLRKNENLSLYANINKFKKFTGWQPKITLDEGIQKTIKFYRGLI